MRRVDASTRLLLRVPSWLGDFVMAEPALAACAEALEQGRLASLSLAGPPRFFELLEGRFEGARRLEPQESWRGHDTALFLDGSLRSLWRATRASIGERIAWFSGGRFLLATAGFAPARERGGRPLHLGAPGRGLRTLPRPFGAACAELLGSAGLPVIERAPRLVVTGAAAERACLRLEGLGIDATEPFLVLDASARPGSAKAAPPGLWSAVLTRLHAARAPRVLLLTAPGEESLGRELAARAPRGAVALTDPPPSLPELAALAERAALFLGPDSGPRHLAAAVGTRAVVLFGPSDPRHTADHGTATTRLRERVPCGPCHRERCDRPPARQLVCFESIDPERVAEAVLARLAAD